MSATRNLLPLLLALVAASLGVVTQATAQIAFRSKASATSQPVIAFVSSSSATMGAAGTTATIALREKSSNTTTGSSLSLAMPTGTVEDDMMIAYVVVATSDASPSLPGSVSPPAGWYNYENDVLTSATEPPGVYVALFRKRATAGEAGPYVFTASGGTPTGMVGGILSFSGTDAVTPFASNSATINKATGNVATAPSRAAPGIANTMLVTFHTYASSSTWTAPSGATAGTLTEAFQASSIAPPAAAGVSMIAGYKPWPTNIATGTVSATANSGAPANNEGTVAGSVLLRPAASITINAPANLAAGDVMIASISVRGSLTGVQAPAGWTLVRRTNGNTDVQKTVTSLFVYRKLATASDPGSSYTFTAAGAVNGVAGIAAYRNVDGSTPIDVEGGIAASSTGSNRTLSGPQISTTVANTQLVTSFTISNAINWQNASGGLTERVDVIQPTTPGSTGVSLAMHDVARAATGTAGPFTADNIGGENDAGAVHMLALRPGCSLTISKPTSPAIVTGDVMVAAISVRDQATATSAPAGWTLASGAPVNNTTASNTISLFVYVKPVASAAAEPASYQWTFSNCDFAAGGIQAFSGVDPAAPVSVSAGQASADSLTHAAPTVTPAVANTMLVYAFAFRSSATWTASSGTMTEDYDTAIPAPANSVGLAIASYHETGPAGAGTTTTARSATASNDSDTGVTFTLALKPLVTAVVPTGFNAYDTGTAAGATSGFIQTKVAGASVTLHAVALKTGPAIETGYVGTVHLALLDSSDNSGGLVSGTNCRSSWTVIQTLSDITFAAGDNGRKAFSFTQNNSYRDARIRVTSTDTPAVVGCSNDNFAIRPASFSVAATDSNWSTAAVAGTVPPDRSLANTVATGGNVHKAGQPFTITVTPSPATAALYDGSPTVSTLTCVLGSTCTAAMLTPGTFAGNGTRVSNTATYSEAGAFNLTLVDQTYASVDSSDGTPTDCSAASRYICQSPAPVAVGRFVPDHFTFTSPSIPALRTFNTTSCSTRSFTYIGQPFWYSTLPSALLNAVNLAGTVTANYGVTSSKPAISEGYADATAPGSAPLNSTAIGSAVLTAGSGTGTYSASVSASAQLSYDRNPSTLTAPFTAAIKLTVTATDSTENAVTGNGIINTATPLLFDGASHAGIPFDSGAQFRYGRLQIGTASGSHLAALAVPMETQYSASGTTFVTNTADNCTTLSTANFGLGNYAGNLNSGETTPSLPGAFAAGKQSLTLSAPGVTAGQANTGSVDLVVNLGSTIDSCTTFKPVPGTTGANQPWLRGRWCGATESKDTTGRATFGIRLGSDEVIHYRENF